MSAGLDWLNQNREGLLLALELLAGLALVTLAFCWIFALGRYSNRQQVGMRRNENLRYLITEALTKIINDFRHLLALIVVLIFAGALVYALAQAEGSLSGIKEALQAVTATLGGLVGSIIGYYFGESKSTRPPEERQPPAVLGSGSGGMPTVEQKTMAEEAPDAGIQPARGRPRADGGDA